MNGQVVWGNSHKYLTNKAGPPEADQKSWSRQIKFIWVLGIMALLPSDMIKLPLNMNVMDCWILMGLPFFWLSFFREKQVISLSYLVPIFLILVGSLASTLVSPVPKNSMIVILKEIYLFIWFITLTSILSKIHTRDFRHILVFWSGIVLLHGVVILLQFVSKDFFRFIVGLVGETNEYEIYRASGLFINPNKAAFFQLLGFVPVMLTRPSKKVGIILGFFLLLTIFATGSMGATLAFIVGLTITVTIISLIGHFDVILKIFVRSALIIAIIGGSLFFFVNQNEHYQNRLEQIIFGRAKKSSEGRFNIWNRATGVFEDHGVALWGIGPENFREVDWKEKQLHNDFLAFAVERGLIALTGLVLFAIIAASRAVHLLLLYNKHPDPAGLVVVVFLAAISAAMVESLTHQTFHFRELWMILAFQEAILFHLKTSESDVEPVTRPLNDPSRHDCGLVAQPDVPSG